MKKEEINLRDPFVLYEDGTFYLYGSRAKNFACKVNGFDVYTSTDLVDWSEPIECFESGKFGMNKRENWAPEVHKYKGKYYLFATFAQDSDIKGTYSLCSESPLGPFVPHSKGPLTPAAWECLDGTLFVDEDGTPYLVFCHEFSQIRDGEICYVRLSEELDAPVGEPVTIFSASSCPWADPWKDDLYVTDGPFLYRSKTGELFLIWSSFIKGNYAEMVVRFKNGKFGLELDHLEPLLDSDGGHGMIFSDGEHTYFTYHAPNTSLQERPEFCPLEDLGDRISIRK